MTQPDADNKDTGPAHTPAFDALPKDWQDYVGKLRRENESYRNRATEWQTKHDELSTKYSEAGDLLGTANKKLEALAALEDQHEKDLVALASAQSESERLRAAVAAGLPVDMADRLKGTNADEWAADAQTLAERFGKGAQSSGYVDHSQGKGNSVTALNDDALTAKFRELFT